MTLTRKITGIITVLLGINLLFPFFAIASEEISGTEQIIPGDLQILQTPADFNFPQVVITNPVTTSTNYVNPETTSTTLTAEDKRFSGGFEVQLTASDYSGQAHPGNTIPLSNLSVVTKMPLALSAYNQSTLFTNSFDNNYQQNWDVGCENNCPWGYMANLSLPFDFPMFSKPSNRGYPMDSGNASNEIYVCTNGFIVAGGDAGSLDMNNDHEHSLQRACNWNNQAYNAPAYDWSNAQQANYGVLMPFFSPNFNIRGIYFKMDDTSANFIFTGCMHSGPCSGPDVAYEISLFPDGHFEYNYGSVTNANLDHIVFPPYLNGQRTVSIGLFNGNNRTFTTLSAPPFDTFSLGNDVSGHQIRFSENQPYNESTNLLNVYDDSRPSWSLIDGSTEPDAIVTQTLPFNFFINGGASDKIIICSSGMVIAGQDSATLTPGDFTAFCGFTGPPPAGNYGAVLSYLAMQNGTPSLTTNISEGHDDNGIYYEEVGDNEVHIRFKGNLMINGNPEGDIEFEVILLKNGNIEIHYGTLDDSYDTLGDNLILGLYNGNDDSIILTDVDPFVYQTAASDLTDEQIRFLPNSTSFIDIKKPGTPVVFSPTNAPTASDPEYYTSFTEDQGHQGFSVPVQILDGTACEFQGRLGSYSIYPSFLLQVPPTTKADTYQNTLTYTIIDKTIPTNTSYCVQP